MPGSWSRRDTWCAIGVTGLGALLRVQYLLRLEVPPYDPWRHLALIRNLRQGLGFTLFDGQPYIWYQPPWYYLCAALPPSWGPQWVAGFFSLACIPLLYGAVRLGEPARPRLAAVCGALLVAACGPFIAFTCHYGPEAFAVALLLVALVLSGTTRAELAGGTLAGLLCGLALAARVNLLFDLLLLGPGLRKPRRLAAFLVGLAAPLAWTWWRNHAVIARYPWIFTWDGLATPRSEFGFLSTLVIQLHPAVQEGLRRLHVQIVPLPEWFRDPSGTRWDSMLFLACGVVALLASRRLGSLVAGGAALIYFLAFDATLSAHFFRIYLVVFPPFFLAAGALAGDWVVTRRPLRGVAAVVLVGGMLAGGARELSPPPTIPLELVTPPAELLADGAYLVNSGFYHPESLIYRFPDKRFVGMPLDAHAFDEFRRSFPAYREVLWHDFSVQPELETLLRASGRYHEGGAAVNEFGRRYTMWRED